MATLKKTKKKTRQRWWCHSSILRRHSLDPSTIIWSSFLPSCQTTRPSVLHQNHGMKRALLWSAAANQVIMHVIPEEQRMLIRRSKVGEAGSRMREFFSVSWILTMCYDFTRNVPVFWIVPVHPPTFVAQLTPDLLCRTARLILHKQSKQISELSKTDPTVHQNSIVNRCSK